MSKSAYATIITAQLAEPEKVLFLKRSNDELWLPGGAIEEDYTDSKAALYSWGMKYLSHWDWRLFGIGMWHLSPTAGEHEVHLFGSYLSTGDSIQVRDTTSGLTTELAWLNKAEIRLGLENKIIPWGQAKMAVYSLLELYDKGQRSKGEQLKDDLSIIGSEPDWRRPT